MAVVAGLFNSEAEATQAMDKLLREHIDHLDTRVIDPRSTDASQGPDVVLPVIPNTSGGVSGSGNTGLVAGAAALGGASDWLNDMNDVERNFYSDAYREGSTLALAKVHDKDAGRVRELFRQFGARTYEKK